MKPLATFLLLRTPTKELLASCFFFVVIISLLFWCVSPPPGTVENGKPNGNTESEPLAESRSSDPPTLPQTPVLSAGAVLLGGGALEQTFVFTRWGILYTEGPF